MAGVAPNPIGLHKFRPYRSFLSQQSPTTRRIKPSIWSYNNNRASQALRCQTKPNPNEDSSTVFLSLSRTHIPSHTLDSWLLWPLSFDSFRDLYTLDHACYKFFWTSCFEFDTFVKELMSETDRTMGCWLRQIVRADLVINWGINI